MAKQTTRGGAKAARNRAAARAKRRRHLTIVGGVAAAVALFAVVIVAGRGTNDGPQPQPSAESVGRSTADVALAMLDGFSATFADYQGKPLVVNFFASWCIPCLAEMPGFERVSQNLGGQVAFLGINLQDRPEDGLRVIEQTGVTYDIARDPDGSLFQAFGAVSMPTTVFIDSGGNVVDVHSGEISAGALADRIQQVLLS